MIKIIYEDKNIIVLDKPAGILAHETQAREKHTIVSYLVDNKYLNPKLAWPDSARPGIVHRLDKDTSGIIIIAKTPEVLANLQQQFKSRDVQKTYLALVLGDLPKEQGKIEAPISRGKAGTQKVQEFTYSFSKKSTRPAVTLYQTATKYKFQNNILTLVEAKPQTGRMHQIRVHLKYLGYPIIGDPLYNTKSSRRTAKALGLDRQFLHAAKIEFQHPKNGRKITFESSLPKDLKDILAKLTTL